MNDATRFAEPFADTLWQGYLRRDGTMGIRNKVLVMYTVECASFVAEEITRTAGDRDVEVIGFRGCWDNAFAVRLLIALLRHPNVGAALIVGLGCEHIQADKLAAIAKGEGKPAASLYIQEAGGTRNAVAAGRDIVARMREALRDTPRRPMGVQDLVVGAECGGSDYTSGLAGNAVVGRVFDGLVGLGGTAVFEEIMEAVGLEDHLVSRAATPEVAGRIRAAYAKMLGHCREIRQFAIAPGNFKGGLSTIEEKSMGAVVKSGRMPITGVLKVSERPASKGLFLLDTVPDPYHILFGKAGTNDNEGILALIGCGCHMVLMVTGRGTVVGSPIAPVVKITGNGETYRRMIDDMDYNAGVCLSGEQTLDEAAAALFRDILGYAGGREVKAEILGHKEYCIPYKYQTPPCRRESC